MPAIYINVYYRAGLYADFGINIYFLLASLYGWIVWKWGKKKQKETSDKDSETSGIRHFDRSTLPAVAGVFLVLFLLIGWILIQFTDSTVPWLDSFTTAASIIAMWMLAQKQVEQWLVWIVVDLVSSGLYIYKGLYFTAALYTLYAVIALLGYRKWLIIMNQK